MHIAIVTRNMGAGGAERVIAQLLNEWAEQGITCSLICLEHVEPFYKLSDKVNYYNVPFQSHNRALNKIGKYISLRNLVCKIRPDVVLSMPEEIGIYVIPALIGTKIPVVVSERNNPWVMPYKKITRVIRKIVYPFANGFIFQTECAASFFSKKIRAKGIVLKNPLDLERIPKPYIGSRRKTIVAAGRFEKQKNFTLLIDAFAKICSMHNDYKLIIYGDGTLRNALTIYASQVLPAGSYEFPGKTTDLLTKINNAGAFVLSSDYEGIPNVLIEALAMGVPCISTDCPSGGPRELISDGKNGLLVPINDVDLLADRLERVISKEIILTPNPDEIKKSLDSRNLSRKWYNYLEKIAGAADDN